MVPELSMFVLVLGLSSSWHPDYEKVRNILNEEYHPNPLARNVRSFSSMQEF